MSRQERMTAAVTLVLIVVGAWFVAELRSAPSLAQPLIGAMIGAVVLTALLAGVAAGAVALLGGRTDERDRRIAVGAQAVRGYFYLILVYAGLGYAIFAGLGPLANGLFAAILTTEILSGLLMLVLYRRAA